MKLLLAVSMILAMIMFGACIFKTYKEKNKRELADIVRIVLELGLGIVLVNFVSLLVADRTVVIVCYCLYFSMADWMIFFLFKFTTYFIGRGKEFERIMKVKVVYALLGLDTVFMLLNIFFENQFTVKESVLFNTELYYYIEPTPFFYIHFVFVMLMALFGAANLYYRAFHSPVFYRKKYLLIAVVQTALMIMNVLMTEAAIDFSVLGYIIEGLVIYYCALVYTPQRLVSKTLSQVSEHMSVGLYVLDKEGAVLYYNDSVKSLIAENSPPQNSENQSFAQWCELQYTNSSDSFITEKTFYKGNEEIILKIQFQRLFDTKKQIQGGYFIVNDVTSDYRKLRHEHYLATHDALTGIYNKEYFYKKCEQYINEYSSSELLMICTDIKDFKMINDFFGTKHGDNVLTSYAEILKNNLNNSLVYGRIGNDIFGILILKNDFDEKKYADEIQKPFSCIGDTGSAYQMINYMGIYEIKNTSLPVSVMCDRAKMAINSVKGDYHKRVAYYDDVLRSNIMHEKELISELDKAIREEQFQMYLQPQMSSDGKMLGGEALVRWIHPVKGRIMPNDFIPVFEKNGLISEVDLFIWEVACRQLRKWKDEGKEDLYISVNISPRDFYFLNIHKVFTDLISKYNLDPKSLKLEITETAVVMDFNRQLELISRLRQSGFVVEMDDFGSGYSSLNMLKDIHVDVLKIDMAFLRKAEDEERSKIILQMIISLSNQLGMPVITEGVESAEQVRFLTEMGCDMFQGYYFAKPMPVENFEELYELNRREMSVQR